MGTHSDTKSNATNRKTGSLKIQEHGGSGGKIQSICEEVTNRIVETMKRGTRPWAKRWDQPSLVIPLRHNGQQYRGINILTLWLEALENAYRSPYWMTFKQAVELGGCIRKGERSTVVFYYGSVSKQDPDEETESCYRFLKYYRVFNAEQVEGLPDKYYLESPEKVQQQRAYRDIDSWIDLTGATIRHGSDRACYRARTDDILLPEFSLFRDTEQYYATVLHELTHWTKHKNRLDRNYGAIAYGDEGYAKEELVAELGSAFLGASFGLRPDHIEDHARYLEHWIDVLEGDHRHLFKAAAAAQLAVDWLFDRAGVPGAVVMEHVA